MFGMTGHLRQRGVMGINRRNAEYTLIHNQRRLYPLVDDKVLTKQLAQQAGIAVPELYGVVEIEYQVRHLPKALAGRSEFVVKPARGSGGDGIVVITGRRKGGFHKASGLLITAAELHHHVSNILSGMYSLGGNQDKALIEALVKFDPVFDDITYLGVPDIRIIIFLGVPVMAMVRLPTRLSDGKANLHQGAIGVGVDIATGKMLSAVWRNEIVTEHPDTGVEVGGVQVPCWDQMLDIATRCYDMTGLGYQGVDLVLDRDRGPLLLELNARPGLNIQIANRAGLVTRLKLVEQMHNSLVTVAQRMAFAKQHFAVV